MQSFDDLARAAEEAEVTDIHGRPITDADLGETATEGAQVVMEGSVPAPVSAPLPELSQVPAPVATLPEQPPVSVAPTSVASEPLAPFSAQITQDTAPIPAPVPIQPAQLVAAPQPTAPPQPTPEQIESPTPPPAPGTMPGQTVTPQSHIIADSYPKPTTGVDPLSGIAV